MTNRQSGSWCRYTGIRTKQNYAFTMNAQCPMSVRPDLVIYITRMPSPKKRHILISIESGSLPVIIFIIIINDLPQLSEDGMLSQFAVDTAVQGHNQRITSAAEISIMCSTRLTSVVRIINWELGHANLNIQCLESNL